MPFYGWTIVAVSLIVTFCSGPGQTYVFSVFVDPILASTGLPRTSISLLYTVATFVAAVTVMLIGRLVDRFGARPMMLWLAAGLALACLCTASANGFVMLLVGFAALRTFGGSALPVSSTLLVNQWFVRQRGRALALSSTGIALSSALLPPLARVLIDAFSWRVAYVALGLAGIVVIVPLVLALVRSRPEDVGLLPDGDLMTSGRPLPASDVNLGNERRPIFSSPAFWLRAFPLSAPTFIATALIFHQVSIFAERGLGPEIAAAVFIPSAAASVSATLLSGFLIDRTGPTQLQYVMLTTAALSLLLLQSMQGPLIAIGYSLLFGAYGGMQSVIQSVTWPYYYGRQGLGSVLGAATMLNIVAAALGPLPVAALQQRTGDYAASLALLGLILALCFVTTLAQRALPAQRASR